MMSRATLEERKSEYFSKIEQGAILTGIVEEYISDSYAIVEIDGFLVRCKMEKKLILNSKVRLKLVTKDLKSEKFVLKVL